MNTGDRTVLLLLWATAAALSAGCDRRDEKITVYRTEKAPLQSSSPALPPMGGMPPSSGMPPGLPTANPGSAPAVVSGTVPPNWEAQPPSQMRQASYQIRGENGTVADLSLVTLGASGGNVLDNVNRWLGQLGQPPINEEQLAKTVERLPGAPGNVAVVDLNGKPEQGDPAKDGRIIAAIAPTASGTSFFKMRGNAELVGAEKGNFLKWVSSVRVGTPPPDPIAASAPAAPGDMPQIQWELPPGWTPAAPAPMRYAGFNAAAANGEKADVSVVTFPGDGGSDLDNVNRWRQQIGLAPEDGKATGSIIQPLQSSAGEFATIDLTGGQSRVVAAWLRRDGRSWFFKLTGPPAAVEDQRANFVKFVQSVQF